MNQNFTFYDEIFYPCPDIAIKSNKIKSIDFSCLICNLIKLNSFTCKSCAALYCSECASTEKFCLLCTKKFIPETLSTFSQKCLLSLKFECPDNGCKKSVEYSHFFDKLKDCKFNLNRNNNNSFDDSLNKNSIKGDEDGICSDDNIFVFNKNKNISIENEKKKIKFNQLCFSLGMSSGDIKNIDLIVTNIDDHFMELLNSGLILIKFNKEYDNDIFESFVKQRKIEVICKLDLDDINSTINSILLYLICKIKKFNFYEEVRKINLMTERIMKSGKKTKSEIWRNILKIRYGKEFKLYFI